MLLRVYIQLFFGNEFCLKWTQEVSFKKIFADSSRSFFRIRKHNSGELLKQHYSRSCISWYNPSVTTVVKTETVCLYLLLTPFLTVIHSPPRCQSYPILHAYLLLPFRTLPMVNTLHTFGLSVFTTFLTVIHSPPRCQSYPILHAYLLLPFRTLPMVNTLHTFGLSVFTTYSISHRHSLTTKVSIIPCPACLPTLTFPYPIHGKHTTYLWYIYTAYPIQLHPATPYFT